MCGIVGIVRRGEVRRGDFECIDRLSELMRRRGPDDDGMWCDSRAVFGFRRLAIIDPSPAGHQPMCTRDGRYVIVFNGEVYNFRELRNELESTGVRFRSASDTEVVLESLVRWGKAALNRFNGIFALAFFDTREASLLLARDPIGVKPLYFLEHREGVLFSSQFDQVMRHPWARDSALDFEALQLYLRFGYVPSPRSMLRGASMLSPGHSVMVRDGRAQSPEQFYFWPEASGELMGTNDAVVAAESVIGGAVRRQLMSDVPLGVFLSGGVDSPLVAALAQEAREDRVDAFTIGSDDPELDESTTSRAIADHIGVNQILASVTALDATELVARHSQAFSEPFADHSSIPTLLVSELARERVTVSLSGDGGDELFFGYPRFRKVLGTHAMFRLPRSARVLRYAAGRLGALSAVPAGVRFADVGAWYLDSHSYWHQGDLQSACPELASLPVDFDLYRSPRTTTSDELAQWLRRTELEGHLQRILLKVDRASMYHHLEVRVPLLDLDVVELAMRTDPNACMTEAGDKAVLRSLLARRTASRTDGEKKGFTVPIGDWLRSSLREQLEDLLFHREPRPEGLIDRRSLRRMYDEHLAGRDRTLPLWTMLCLQLWWDEHYAGQTYG